MIRVELPAHLRTLARVDSEVVLSLSGEATLCSILDALEARHPVRLVAFALRRGSGGAGRHRGGDGLVRRYRFLAPVTASLLTERRAVAPYGLAGGLPGARGRNAVTRRDGRVEELPSHAVVALAPGDELVIETPGGGGYGAPRSA